MKKQKIFFLIVFNICLFLNGITYKIKQDGSGDFLTIQEGINVAVDNDTVLVFPGVYFENIIIQEKSLTIGSLTLTTGDNSYKHTTIIDGNQASSCIQVRGEYTWDFQPVFSDSVNIIGFTLQHGIGESTFESISGSSGGGILLFFSKVLISECIIKNNTCSLSGGGIKVFESSLTISGSSVHDNKSQLDAGGISVGGFYGSDNSMVYFDNQNLCSIYNNYGNTSCDFRVAGENPFINVIVDTFTVSDPSTYYIGHCDAFGIPHPELISFSMQHAYFEQINSDIYVSAEGDDNNSGLSEDEPLQTIVHALILIKSDSLNHKTIHIEDGIYSQSFNNQWFPIRPKPYVSIIGESMENTIIDAENLSAFINRNGKGYDFKIKNLSFINGNSDFIMGIYFKDSSHGHQKINLENIIIRDSKNSLSQIYLGNIESTLNRVFILDNQGGNALSIYCSENDKTLVKNCRIVNNTPWNLSDDNRARPVEIIGNMFTLEEQNLPKIIFSNCEINNCYDAEWMGSWSSAGIYTFQYLKLDLINCTIADNSGASSAAYGLKIKTEGTIVNLTNTIIYRNYPAQIGLFGDYDEENPIILNLKNSVIQHNLADGFEQIYDYWGNSEINWLGGNMRENPLWNISENNEYFLAENSPCINAGTLDLPDGMEIPETDLAGNPRIYGDTIDIGAYEWNPNISSSDNYLPSVNDISAENYPNPFKLSKDRGCGTTISYEIPRDGKVDISIYNIKGQKVKSLFSDNASKGKHYVLWNGENNQGKQVSAGVYFYKIDFDNSKSLIRKMLIMK